MRDLTYFTSLSEEECIHEILRQEEKYGDSICYAAEKILEKNARFIFLSGPSCSGKTTTSLTLIRALEKAGKRVFTFSTDDFFFDREKAPRNERGEIDFDAFSHTDSDTICSCLQALCRGETALLPQFDFETSRRKKETTSLSPDDYDMIILEGIHALNDKILSAVEGQKIYTLALNVTEDITFDGKELFSAVEVRFCRRLIRDFKHRFASADHTFALWRTVKEAEKKWILPYFKNADLFLNTNFSYEVCVEKDQVEALLEKVEKTSPNYAPAQDIIKKLRPVRSLPEELVPEGSPLCEFIH